MPNGGVTELRMLPPPPPPRPMQPETPPTEILQKYPRANGKSKSCTRNGLSAGFWCVEAPMCEILLTKIISERSCMRDVCVKINHISLFVFDVDKLVDIIQKKLLMQNRY